MSAEKIKMMNRERDLQKRIIALSKEKSDIEVELFEMRHKCKHEIIIRDNFWGFNECLFCGKTGFFDEYLKNNFAVITLPILIKGEYMDKFVDVARKKYSRICMENVEWSEEQIRETFKKELKEELSKRNG